MKIFVILKIQHAISWSHKLLNTLNSWKNNKYWELHIFTDNQKNASIRGKTIFTYNIGKDFSKWLREVSFGSAHCQATLVAHTVDGRDQSRLNEDNFVTWNIFIGL